MRLAGALLLLATATLAAAQPPSPPGSGGPTPPSGVALSGIVQDQTGAVLAAATVELVNSSGVVVRTTTADEAGLFRFERVAPSRPDMNVAALAVVLIRPIADPPC